MLDWIIHLWAKASLLLGACRPRLYGAENLPAPGETVIYVPNHTSFIDILVLSGFVPRPFKYLSKIEIVDIPIIGWAMQLARLVVRFTGSACLGEGERERGGGVAGTFFA